MTSAEDFIKRTVDAAPPLSAEQRKLLRSALQGMRDRRAAVLAAGNAALPSEPPPYRTGIQPENPFGSWTKYRARIAALSRRDARDPVAEADARQMLKAARLADAILRDGPELSSAQRNVLIHLLL